MSWFTDNIITPIKLVVLYPFKALEAICITFKSMISDSDGTVSSKRWLVVSFGAACFYTIVYSVTHYKDLILPIFYASLGAIFILSGVATLPEILKIWKGGNDSPTLTNNPPTPQQ